MANSKNAERAAQFTPVTDEQTLDGLFMLSHQRPVIIFKHSTTCPISAAAYRQMSEVERGILLIVVQSARGVSNKVATLTGVRHESPQVIVLKNGKVVWSASHFNITADAVEKVVSKHDGK